MSLVVSGGQGDHSLTGSQGVFFLNQPIIIDEGRHLEMDNHRICSLEYNISTYYFELQILRRKSTTRT